MVVKLGLAGLTLALLNLADIAISERSDRAPLDRLNSGGAEC